MFDALVLWSFCNEFGRKVIIIGADNSSQYHADNRQNNVLVLVGGPTDDINDRIGAAEKNFVINFSQEKTKFSLNLNYNGDEVICFKAGKKSISLKQMIRKPTLHISFV